MNIQADIKWIKSELNSVKDPDLILAFKNLLKYRQKHEQKDWWNEISAEEKTEIKEGIRQADNGELLSHEEVMKNPRKWA